MNRTMPPYEDCRASITPRRPPFERTISFPLLPQASSPSTSKLDYLQEPSSLSVSIQLTPPTSPTLLRSNTNLNNTISPTTPRKSSITSVQKQPTSAHDGNVDTEEIPAIIECPFEVEIARNHSDRPQLFGQGAWSKVYRGYGRWRDMSSAPSTADILTPPPSPQASVPLLVAIKTPLSNSSRTILYNEAITLSHLTRTPSHQNFIVPFYGYIPSSASLVLAPVPLSLSDHLLSSARLSHTRNPDLFSTTPVLGSTASWLDLANRLTTALAWLHEEAGVVHGDIKPGNILLVPNHSPDDFAFDPLLVDFSSSHILSSPTAPSNTLSALTREYTAPELLLPSVLRDPSSSAKPSSDVFSLAVTLIVAATGELMVYQGNLWQRQYMAKQGWNVLDFVRNGEGGMRVPRSGLVERLVEGAVREVGKGRLGALEWRELVGQIRRGEEEAGAGGGR